MVIFFMEEKLGIKKLNQEKPLARNFLGSRRVQKIRFLGCGFSIWQYTISTAFGGICLSTLSKVCYQRLWLSLQGERMWLIPICVTFTS